jgi:hypothetical protein
VHTNLNEQGGQQIDSRALAGDKFEGVQNVFACTFRQVEVHVFFLSKLILLWYHCENKKKKSV